MFAVVFEVRPAEGKKDEYLAHAAGLKPILESIDGFIDNERFESMGRAGWVLSLSTWRDEKAVVRWRAQGKHHETQARGRNAIFSDYHLRVCEVTADSHPPAGLRVIEQRLDVTEIGAAKALTITEISSAPGPGSAAESEALPSRLGFDRLAEGLVDSDIFASISTAGKMVLLTSWKTAQGAERWIPTSFAGVTELRHRRVRNVRDYGMFERREAAQYHPDVSR